MNTDIFDTESFENEAEFLRTCPDYPFFAIDLFCGAGGETTGMELARKDGRKLTKVFACVNHDPNAIESHKANYAADTLHFLEDIRTLETGGLRRMVDIIKGHHPSSKIILHASCECTNFSRAKGGLPRDPDSRTLPEHLYRYIEAIDPDYVTVENVTELTLWEDSDGVLPPSGKYGRKYLQWVENIKSFGYNYDFRILNAADFGAYTSRNRYFGVFAKDGLPINFPEPTHSKKPQTGLFGETKPWKPVKDVLDLKDEGESIFTRKKPLVDATLRRVRAGLEKFVEKNQSVFLVKNYSGDNKSKCISIEGPAGTVTCKDHHSLVKVQFLDQQYGNGTPASIDTACGTLTTNPKQNLVTVNYLMTAGWSWPISSIEKPCPTVVASQDKSPIYLVSVETGERLSHRESDTATMKDLKTYCRDNGIADVKMRMLKVEELLAIMGFPKDYKLVGTVSEAKKYIGNAVEVGIARQLMQALASA